MACGTTSSTNKNAQANNPEEMDVEEQYINLTNIYMMTPKVGWSLYQNSLLRTVDGGKSWSIVTPSEIYVSPGQFFLLDGQTAWVIVSNNEDSWSIYRTNNRGETWVKGQEKIKIKGTHAKLHFIDQQNGWIMILLKAGLGYSSVAVLHTSDAGENWSMVTDINKDDVPGALPYSGNKTGIYFKDSLRGWITGITTADDIPWLYKTHDGGKSWYKQMLSLPHREFITLQTNEPTFFNSKGVISVDAEFTVDDDKKLVTYFFTTKNGGESWERRSPIESSTPHFIEYDFVSMNTGWGTDGYNIYHTKDSAQSWTVINTFENIILQKLDEQKSDITWIDFVTDQIGWVVIKTDLREFKLFQTFDGGITWKEVLPEFQG
jgi:photosystem II stability/assembly factor-like uncharacterized protein